MSCMPIGELALEDRPEGLWCKGQLLMALPLDSRATLRGFGFGKGALGVFGLRLPGGSLLLLGCLRETLARRDRGGIARNMPDQALALSGRDDCRMQLLRQFRGGEFGKSAGELRFMRQRAYTAPATELT